VSLRVAIVGCGAIGAKRAAALPAGMLRVCCDVELDNARNLAKRYSRVLPTSDLGDVLADDTVAIVIVATRHDALAEIAAAAAAAGKHVLIEKPGARRAAELDAVVDAARKAHVLVRVGFNHRYHPALIKAKEIVASGTLEDLLYVRARYGHGGRIGYGQEWRAQPDLSGGGEAIDQGMHVIDLSRMFLGDFTDVAGRMRTYFWNMPVEDNAFFMLSTSKGQVALLHTSWTEWKNMFSFELFGRMGKLEITGLGGSYGVERITHYRMLPQMGPPETVTHEYPFADTSWSVEFETFLEDIRLGREPFPGVLDAQAALRIIETIYAEERQ
jgi:predicted dehydrogenase